MKKELKLTVFIRQLRLLRDAIDRCLEGNEYFRCQDCGHLRERWEAHSRNGRLLDTECLKLREAAE